MGIVYCIFVICTLVFGGPWGCASRSLLQLWLHSLFRIEFDPKLICHLCSFWGWRRAWPAWSHNFKQVIMHDTPRPLFPPSPTPQLLPHLFSPAQKRPFHLKLWFCRNSQNLSFWLPTSNYLQLCHHATWFKVRVQGGIRSSIDHIIFLFFFFF